MPEIRRVIDELKEMKGTSPWTRTVIVDIGGKGDFTSVKAACDYVATQSPTWNSRWTIYIQPGIYAESPFTVPEGTSLIGLGCPSLSGNEYRDSITIRTTTDLVSGAFITIDGSIANSQFVNLFLYVWMSSSATSDCQVISCSVANSNLNFSGCRITAYNPSVTYNLTCIKTLGNGQLLNCRIGQLGTAKVIALESGATFVVQYCWINSKYGVQCNSGNLYIFMSKFGDTTPMTLDLNNVGGNIYVSETQYSTSSGTITNVGRLYDSVRGLREAANSTSTPLILKGATSQSANLTEWRSSLDAVLASIDKDGKISAAGFSSGATPGVSGSFTTVDGKTVTVTNGLITAIV